MSGALVVGAGPGVGAAVARVFAATGMSLGLFARTRRSLDAVTGSLPAGHARVVTREVDVANESALRRSLDEVVAELGPPEVVVYNAALVRRDSLADLTLAEQLRAYAVTVGGAVTTAATCLPRMTDRGNATMLFTSGMPVPMPDVLSLSLGKAALRALAEALAVQFEPAGIHVAAVTIAGEVVPGSAFDPALIAAEYLTLHREPRDRWRRLVDFPGGTR
jgi:short-subunit dehydrogenase